MTFFFNFYLFSFVLISQKAAKFILKLYDFVKNTFNSFCCLFISAILVFIGPTSAINVWTSLVSNQYLHHWVLVPYSVCGLSHQMFHLSDASKSWVLEMAQNPLQ